MKKRWIALAVLATAQVSGQEVPQDAKEVIKSLYTEALGEQQGYKWLHHICTEIGPRPSGSEASNQAARYTMQMMLDAGADTAWLQPVEVPKWHRGDEWSKAYAGGGESVDLPTTALGGSIATPEEGVRAEVVEVSSFEELADLGEAGVQGKIVFFNTYMDHSKISTFNAYGGAVKYRWAGAMEAVKYGAVATVMRSVTLLRDDLPHTGAMSYGESENKIPSAAISWQAADKLDAMLEGGSVELELFLDCGVQGTAINYNMIADFKGSQHPDEIMLVGGHIDSWDLGQGAQDDGAGCAHAMQVPSLMKKVGYQNKRTIRVVLWANEEFGLDGAKEYARWARENNVHHWVAMESDGGGDVPRGFGIGADDARVEMVRAFKDVMTPYGLHVFAKGGGGADLIPLRGHDDFFIGFRPESQRYFDFHHSARDRIDAIHPRSLEMGAASMSALYYLLDHQE